MTYTNVNNVLLYTESDMVVKDAVNGLFENNTFNQLFALLNQFYRKPENFCAIDVGAYTGLYTLVFAKHIRFRTTYTFEPNKTVFDRLIANAQLNHVPLFGSVEYHNQAVSSGWGEVMLYSKDFEMTSAASLNKTEETVKETPVKMTSIDEFRPICPVAVMKIDTEGTEIDVLIGAKETIKEDKPILIIETLTKESEQRCVEFLTDLGYDTKNMLFGLDGRNLIAYYGEN